MMIKEALEFLMNAGKAEVIDIDGHNYTTKNLNLQKIPSPSTIQISTLTGLVEYVKSDIDDLDSYEDIFVHVVSEKSVRVLSTLQDDASRHQFLESVAQTPKLILNTYLDAEQFNVMLQSCFLEFGDRAKILSIIGNIKEENVKNTSDDGISQSVVAKKGVVSAEYVTIPNPVILTPFRTFIEVEQPESKFVLRLKDGPQAGLFEADGGEWRLASILRIRKYLEEALPGVKILA